MLPNNFATFCFDCPMHGVPPTATITSPLLSSLNFAAWLPFFFAKTCRTTFPCSTCSSNMRPIGPSVNVHSIVSSWTSSVGACSPVSRSTPSRNAMMPAFEAFNALNLARSFASKSLYTKAHFTRASSETLVSSFGSMLRFVSNSALAICVTDAAVFATIAGCNLGRTCDTSCFIVASSTIWSGDVPKCSIRSFKAPFRSSVETRNRRLLTFSENSSWSAFAIRCSFVSAIPLRTHTTNSSSSSSPSGLRSSCLISVSASSSVVGSGPTAPLSPLDAAVAAIFPNIACSSVALMA